MAWISMNNLLFAQTTFEKYFIDKQLRLDYSQSGNAEAHAINFISFAQEPYWGGPKKNLINPFDYGQFRIKVIDEATGKIIYQNGFSSLFTEWLATEEAQSLRRSFHEVVTMPYPKHNSIIILEERNTDLIFEECFKVEFDPESIFIKKEAPYSFAVDQLVNNGSAAENVDIVIIPEGYTKAEFNKLSVDCDKFIKEFFKTQPFKKHKENFNFWLVKAPSEESGTDNPGKGVWKKTLLNSSFYTFGSERYLTTKDISKVRDVAANAPYDQIYILVNTSKYGGGGIYNYYNLCTSDNAQSPLVFTHEFGHAFGSLADEYDYGSDNFYNKEVEPYECNITTLVDFESKWKDKVKPATPIPTPDDKRFKNDIGVFEGAGYTKKGVYRSEIDCKMRSNNTNDFCKVCYENLVDMIKHYSDQ
ncbi:M64 family metallopeptidase [Aureibacter tunicatorum]|nr:M64 family metallopeptidase [Aureibacter tunicatorum]